MRNETQPQAKPREATRLQRTAAAVIAQYIQDLAQSVDADPCAPAA
ncbi:MAG TPA: hypothetical protein VGG87_05415 [Solirubrobacteraceae bacterium]